ncbi:MAG: hypothetical protein ACI8WT_004590 [Clostridium sp.]|jgi:hypothetical protein
MGKHLKNQNHIDISLFKNRLWSLMGEEYNSPMQLAMALYNAGLVGVKQSENFNDERVDRNNAYGSIEKKIRKHCNSDTSSEVQGEFILAYSQFFGCSADYLLGFTDIRTNNMDIRQICEKTKLSEEAVKHIIDSPVQTAWWSKLFKTSLFIDLPGGWLRMLQELHIRHIKLKDAKPEQEIVDELKEAGNLSQANLIKHPAFKPGVDAETASSAYYGHLAKINAQVTDYFLRGTDEQFSTALKQADGQ